MIQKRYVYSLLFVLAVNGIALGATHSASASIGLSVVPPVISSAVPVALGQPQKSDINESASVTEGNDEAEKAESRRPAGLTSRDAVGSPAESPTR